MIDCIYAPDCEEQIDPARSKLKACKKCRANICFWVRQPPARVIRRVRNLRKYSSRMADVITVPEEKKNAKRHLQAKSGKACKIQVKPKRAKRRDTAQTGATVH